MSQCTACGNVVPVEDLFCGKCGKQKAAVPAVVTTLNAFEQDPLLSKLQADLEALDAVVQSDKRKLDDPNLLAIDEGEAAKRLKWEVSPPPQPVLPTFQPSFPSAGPPQMPGVPQLQAPFKRTLCKFFLSGFCKQGVQCTFAHGEHELAGGPGTGNITLPEGGVFPHVVPSGEICMFFARAGWCKYGEHCKHSHAGQAQTPSVVPPPEGLQLGTSPAPSEGAPKDATEENPFERYVGRLQQAAQRGATTSAAGVVAPPPAAVVPPPDFMGQAPQVVLPPQPQVVVPPSQFMTAPSLMPPPDGLPVAMPAAGGKGSPVQYDGYKYKTEPCKFFPIGKCAKGDACTYLHDVSELQAGQTVPALGDPMMVGALPPRPAAPSGEICKFFAKAGWCKYGEACKHMHTGGAQTFGSTGINGVDTLAMPQVAAPLPLASGPDTPGYKTRMCSYFAAGSCVKNDLCTFAHGQAELAFYTARESAGTEGKAPCKFYALGTCTKGEACSFSHGDEGVRQTDLSAAAFGPAAQALALNAMAANGFQPLDSASLSQHLSQQQTSFLE